MFRRENDIMILTGAGCSVEAGISESKKMIEKLEELIKNNNDWKEHSDLYYYVKSSILYSDGIRGKFDDNFDIERLVNVLSELEKKEHIVLYPFIGSWNPRLLEVIDPEFKKIKEFKQKIVEQLKRWVQIDDYKVAEYYKNFFYFQSEYNHSLKIFSLNYDLCFEKNKPENKDIERGFDSNTRTWDCARFERREDYEPPSIYLYKLHGSIDWKRDENKGNILREVEAIPETPDLIFGTNYKMQYIDPYLFYAHEFRKYSLESKVILAIGYSFRDAHINGILRQSLQNNRDRKIVIVSPDANEIVERFSQLKKQIIPCKEKAKDFLDKLSINLLESIVKESR